MSIRKFLAIVIVMVLATLIMLATPVVFAALILGFAAPYRLLRGWWKGLPSTLLRLYLEALAEVWELYVELLDALLDALQPHPAA